MGSRSPTKIYKAPACSRSGLNIRHIIQSRQSDSNSFDVTSLFFFLPVGWISCLLTVIRSMLLAALLQCLLDFKQSCNYFTFGGHSGSLLQRAANLSLPMKIFNAQEKTSTWNIDRAFQRCPRRTYFSLIGSARGAGLSCWALW